MSNPVTTSIDEYLHHYERAERALGSKGPWPDLEHVNTELAAAQVHATLALATAVTRMVDSYNGWKDIGK